MNNEENETEKDEKPPPDFESESTSNANKPTSAISRAPQPQMILVAAPMSANYGYGYGQEFRPPVRTPAKRGCYKESGECCCGFSRTCCICTWISVAASIFIVCSVLSIVMRFVVWNLKDERDSVSKQDGVTCCVGDSLNESQIKTQSYSEKALCKGGHKREDPNCKTGATCEIATFWGVWQTNEYTAQKDCYDFPVVMESGKSDFENGTCQCSTKYCNCPPRLRPTRRFRSRSHSRSRARKMKKKMMKKYFGFPLNNLFYIPIASDVFSYTFDYVFST